MIGRDKFTAKDVQWGSSLDQQLERLIGQVFVRKRTNEPQYLAEFPSTSLPSVTEWRNSVIVVTDKGCLAFSNGAAWVRADGSAL